MNDKCTDYNVTRKTPPRFPAVDQAIKERGTVAAFLRATGVSMPTYYKMQAGKTQPTLGTIYAVLKYTGLSFDQAFGETTKNAGQRGQDADRR